MAIEATVYRFGAGRVFLGEQEVGDLRDFVLECTRELAEYRGSSANTQDAWSHLLPSVVLTSYEPPFANLTDNAYELGGGTTYAQSFSYDSPGATYTANQVDLVLYSDGTGGAGVDIQLRSAPRRQPSFEILRCEWPWLRDQFASGLDLPPHIPQQNTAHAGVL